MPQAGPLRALHAREHLLAGRASVGLHHAHPTGIAGRLRRLLTVFLSSLERPVTAADAYAEACSNVVMLDILFVAVTLLFFVVAAGVRRRLRADRVRRP